MDLFYLNFWNFDLNTLNTRCLIKAKFPTWHAKSFRIRDFLCSKIIKFIWIGISLELWRFTWIKILLEYFNIVRFTNCFLFKYVKNLGIKICWLIYNYILLN